MRGLIILIVCVALNSLDMSRVYHYIRGQAMIKLYVLTGMIEVRITEVVAPDLVLGSNDCRRSLTSLGARWDKISLTGCTGPLGCSPTQNALLLTSSSPPSLSISFHENIQIDRFSQSVTHSHLNGSHSCMRCCCSASW